MLIKVKDIEICYFLTYLTYLKMVICVENDLINKCCVAVLNIAH